MTTQTIEVEGLPEGCEAVAVQFEPNYFNKYTGDDGYVYFEAKVKVKKIQPRRIVLEEITKEEYYRIFHDEPFAKIYDMRESYWQEVKETDIPLTNDEPNVKMGKSEGDADETNLSLSLEQCKKLFRSKITDSLEVFQLVEDFIKENS